MSKLLNHIRCMRLIKRQERLESKLNMKRFRMSISDAARSQECLRISERELLRLSELKLSPTSIWVEIIHRSEVFAMNSEWEKKLWTRVSKLFSKIMSLKWTTNQTWYKTWRVNSMFLSSKALINKKSPWKFLNKQWQSAKKFLQEIKILFR